MVVDDDDVVRDGFLRGFRGAGKEVFAAPDAATARRVAAEARPDLVLVDLRLGDDWGLDVIAELKAAVPHCAIALVSAYVGTDAAVAAMRAGANHVFAKPVKCAAILREVEHGVPAVEPRREHPTLAQLEWEQIMRVMAECGGNLSEAARRLGLRRQSLQKRLKKPVFPR